MEFSGTLWFRGEEIWQAHKRARSLAREHIKLESFQLLTEDGWIAAEQHSRNRLAPQHAGSGHNVSVAMTGCDRVVSQWKLRVIRAYPLLVRAQHAIKIRWAAQEPTGTAT